MHNLDGAKIIYLHNAEIQMKNITWKGFLFTANKYFKKYYPFIK